MKVKKFIKIFINLFVAGLCVLFSVSESVDAGSTLPPFGYVTIVNENIGGENNFEFVLQRKNSSGIFEFTGESLSTNPDDYNYIGRGFFALDVSTPGEQYRIFEYPPAENWISVSINCVSDNSGTAFIPYSNGVEIHPVYNQDSHITCTFANINGVANGKTPVLFVPGLLGTEIFNKQDKIWPDTIKMITDFNDDFMDVLALDNGLYPIRDLETKAVIKKELRLYDYTEGLINEFANQGYVENQDFFTFPYDWRYGVSGVYPKQGETSQRDITNSDLLKERINEILAQTGANKVDVIAHSMGGLIVKKYAMDNADPKIGKLIFLGVPNLGSPLAIKTLLAGNDFKVPGLNPEEMKKISQNMPAAYDLTPSKGYYTQKGSYLTVSTASYLAPNQVEKLNYEESLLHLNTAGLNTKGILNANNLHSTAFDYFDARTKNVEVYDIVGCKSGTFRGVIDYQTIDMIHSKYGEDGPLLSGDDTVSFESADSIPADNDKKFYFKKAEHGKMPSANGIRQKIVNIITGADYENYSNLITRGQLLSNRSLCELKGDSIIVKSPVDIFVTEATGKIILGADSDNNIHYEIPGASFEIIDGHKYVYLPTDDNQSYDINLKGAGTGMFTLIKNEIGDGAPSSAIIFNDIPVTPEFSGKLDISEGTTKIITAAGQEILPTAQADAGSINDIIAPQTTAKINGEDPKPAYAGNVSISLAAQDFVQDGTTPAGVFSINYRLDDAPIAEYENFIEVLTEGKHSLSFYAGDKMGNKEEEKTIDFVIDKTAPEIEFSFGQFQKDLIFTARDNFSNPENIVIADENGTITAADEAGNTAKLSFAEKNRKQSLRAQLSTLSYNDKEISLSGNKLSFAWFYGYIPKIPGTVLGLQSLPKIPKNNPRTNKLTFLLQQAKLKNGSFIVALYANNKTRIIEFKNKKLNFKNFSGLKIVNFSTLKGILDWSY